MCPLQRAARKQMIKSKPASLQSAADLHIDRLIQIRGRLPHEARKRLDESIRGIIPHERDFKRKGVRA